MIADTFTTLNEDHTMPTDLFHDIEARASKREAVTSQQRDAAASAYWAAIDAIASGDPGGNTTRAAFESVLVTLGLSLDQARHDVATVQDLRKAQADIAVADAAVAAAEADAMRAAAELDDIRERFLNTERAFNAATWRQTDASEQRSALRRRIRDELRADESLLRTRGFTGVLLDPPPPPPPPRRWRFRDPTNVTGQWLQAGAEVDYPAEVTLHEREAVLVGSVTPEMGPPKQVPVPLVAVVGETAEAVAGTVIGGRP